MPWTAFVDGGSRGNPGPAAAGVQISDPTGKTVFAGGFFLGRLTNNQAEYRGMLAALRLFKQAGAEEIAITSDSELMVRQLNGQYKVRSPDLRPLFEQARQELVGFRRWNVRHVLRTSNTRADELANMAMDAGEDVIVTDLVGGTSAPRPSSATPVTAAKSAGGAGISVRVVRAANPDVCQAGMSRGKRFEFTDTTPEGFCVRACPAVAEAILGMQDSQAPVSAIEIRCGHADCGCTFELEQMEDVS